MRSRVYSAASYFAPDRVPRCTCRSINPGTRNFPIPLIFSTPAGIGMLARLPTARMREPATITTESDRGGPPVPSINTAPIIAFCCDSSGGLHAVAHIAPATSSEIFRPGTGTPTSCQSSFAEFEMHFDLREHFDRLAVQRRRLIEPLPHRIDGRTHQQRWPAHHAQAFDRAFAADHGIQ